jgi:hypothetical protein
MVSLLPFGVTVRIGKPVVVVLVRPFPLDQDIFKLSARLAAALTLKRPIALRVTVRVGNLSESLYEHQDFNLVTTARTLEAVFMTALDTRGKVTLLVVFSDAEHDS